MNAISHEPTNAEIFEAVQTLATTVDEQFTELRAEMVTKDYLDEKLADLRGDLVVLMRKEDRKVQRLIELLHTKQVLNDAEMKELLRLEPFSQLSL